MSDLFEAHGMASSGDCGGCGESASFGAAESAGGTTDELPSLEDLESALAQVPAENGGDELALELALAEQDLGAVEDLELDLGDDSNLPTLRCILAVAERYPGLKITFSF